jgi:hypothetical protein
VHPKRQVLGDIRKRMVALLQEEPDGMLVVILDNGYGKGFSVRGSNGIDSALSQAKSFMRSSYKGVSSLFDPLFEALQPTS